VSRLNRAKRFDVLPWQTPGLLTRVSLTAEQTTEAAWFVDARGRQYRGAAAIAAAFAQMGVPFSTLAFFYRVPGIKQLADFFYAWVAKNRYRLPGSTAACAVPPPSVNSDQRHD
jgi:predicted DCC family thiol-disulfide oxidoreductase YuxK